MRISLPQTLPPLGPDTTATFTDTAGTPSGYVVGLDLGKQRDFSALVALEVFDAHRIEHRQSPYDPVPLEVARTPLRRFQAARLHRWQLGTAYNQVAESVRGFMAKLPPRKRRPELVVDRTGVGGPVVEALSSLGLEPVAVTITAGHSENQRSDDDWTVPKAMLASAVDVVLSERRLEVPKSELGEVLANELRAFRVRKTAAGNETFESWREADHDDLVLACALAVWRADTRPQPARSANIGFWRM